MQQKAISIVLISKLFILTSVYTNIHQKIIDKCLKGDSEAQFHIYKLYYKAMYNTSLRIVNDPQEAEDLMQESFLSGFEKLSTYKGEVSFGAWLKRIVVNKSLDSLKRKKLEMESLEYTNCHNLPEMHESTEDEGISVNIERIKTGIHALADGYRVILSLYLLEGYDHDEISGILGITNSTSRSQFTRARRKLVEYLTDYKQNTAKEISGY